VIFVREDDKFCRFIKAGFYRQDDVSDILPVSFAALVKVQQHTSRHYRCFDVEKYAIPQSLAQWDFSDLLILSHRRYNVDFVSRGSAMQADVLAAFIERAPRAFYVQVNILSVRWLFRTDTPKPKFKKMKECSRCSS